MVQALTLNVTTRLALTFLQSHVRSAVDSVISHRSRKILVNTHTQLLCQLERQSATTCLQ